MNLWSLIPMKYVYGAAGALIVAAVLLGGGAWWGYLKGSNKSALVIANYKAEVVDLNTRLESAKGQVMTRVITKYVTKTVHIKDVGEHNANVAINIVPHTCNMSDAWVSVHDSAAAGIFADPTSAGNGADSGIKDTEALAIISDNYDTFHKQKAQLELMQQWVTETNAAIEAANKEAAKKKHWWSK